jgi:amino acid permease
LKRYSELFSVGAILSATIFGAGMFSLPYVFSQAGFIVGLFYLALFTILLATTHYLYSEVVRLTPDKHRFLGYAKIYVGEKGRTIAIFTTGLGILLSLTIFIVLSANFIHLIFPAIPAIYASLMFWVAASIPLLLKIKRIAILEASVVAAIIVIAVVIFIVGIFHPLQPLSSIPLFNWQFVFVPYGAVIFSMAGRSAISSLMEYSEDNGIEAKTVKKAIIMGTIIPAVVYVLFILGVLSLSATVTPDALTGLNYLPQSFLVLLGLMGIFSLWASYISVSREIEGIFMYDLNESHNKSLIAVALVPLILFFLGFRDFIALVGILGGVFLAIEHTMVTLMWRKATGNKPLWSYVVIALFVIGALYVCGHYLRLF